MMKGLLSLAPLLADDSAASGQGLLGLPAPDLSSARMALYAGLINGNYSRGLLGYAQEKANAEQRQLARVANGITLQKSALELDQMRQAVAREAAIRQGLARVAGEETSAANRAAVAPMLDAQPSDAFGTPNVSGVPLFSMAGQRTGGAGSTGTQTARSTYGQGLSNRFLKQAEVYATNGDFERANKLYEQAAKWMPEVHKIEVAMHQGQPVNVITMKDGQQVLSPFSPTPKVHWADTGADIRAIDEYTMQPRGSFRKDMSPDARASNALGWANHNLSAQRLNFERSNAQAGRAPAGYRFKENGQLEAIPGGPADKQAAASADERKAATLLQRLEGSQRQLTAALAKDPRAAKPEVLASGVRGLGFAGAEPIANKITSEARQQVEAAQLDMLDAALTLGTGAAYTREQLEGYRRSFFPQLGDDPATVKDKQARLQNVIDAARIAAGRAGGSVPPAQPSGGATGGWSIQKVN